MKYGPPGRLELASVLLLSALSCASAQDSTATPQNAPPTPLAILLAHDARSREILARASGDSLSPKLQQQFKSHINTAFDFDELSRLSLGAHWAQRSTDERAEFAQLFSAIIKEQNFDRFRDYYRKDNIAYQEEKIDGPQSTVTALIPLEKGDQIEILYHLHLVDNQWRIYDLAVDGASTVDGNRRRYGRYIKKNSYAKLIQQLQKQLDRLTSTNN
jgi:phospholipid transport system substrate-binding protein